jgi:hypothetical protein
MVRIHTGIKTGICSLLASSKCWDCWKNTSGTGREPGILYRIEIPKEISNIQIYKQLIVIRKVSGETWRKRGNIMIDRLEDARESSFMSCSGIHRLGNIRDRKSNK